MLAKDYVYLALIAFSAIVFYLNGFQAGAQRSRKKSADNYPNSDSSDESPFSVSEASFKNETPGLLSDSRKPLIKVAGQTVFGNN